MLIKANFLNFFIPMDLKMYFPSKETHFNINLYLFIPPVPCFPAIW